MEIKASNGVVTLDFEELSSGANFFAVFFLEGGLGSCDLGLDCFILLGYSGFDEFWVAEVDGIFAI